MTLTLSLGRGRLRLRIRERCGTQVMVFVIGLRVVRHFLMGRCVPCITNSFSPTGVCVGLSLSNFFVN